MSINDPNLCTQHDNMCERMSDLKSDMAEMRADIKLNFGSVREDICKLSELFKEVALSQHEMNSMRHTVSSLVAESATTKERLAAAIAERDRIIAEANVEQQRLSRDVTTAHDFIREIRKAVEEEIGENRLFRRTIKIYWGVLAAAALAFPFVWQAFQSYFVISTHVGVK